MKRPRLLPSKAEVRREHSTEVRHLIEEIEGLIERATGAKRDLADDMPDSRDAQARMAAAIQSLAAAAWYLRGTRRVLS